MNTLVKKLKGEVNNSTLLKVGEMQCVLSGAANFNAKTSSQCTLKILTPGVTFTNSEASGLQEQTITSAGSRNIKTSGACVLSFSNKYDMEIIMQNGDFIQMNIDDLEYSTQMQQLLLRGLTVLSYGDISSIKGWSSAVNVTLLSPKIHGNISNIFSSTACVNLGFGHATNDAEHANIDGDISVLASKIPNVENLGLNNTSVAGTLSSLASLRSLESLGIKNTLVSGTLEDFLDGMYNSGNGRTSGTLAINAVGSRVTYNGSAINSALTATFAAGGWSVA